MTEQPHTHPGGGHQASGHGGHSWMMMICCIPMIIIAVALVAAGVVDPGFLLFAVLCVGMMALMMRGMGGMDHGGGAARDDTDRSSHAGHGR